MATTLNTAKVLWLASLAFMVGGFWHPVSLYFGLTLFVIYLFRSRT